MEFFYIKISILSVQVILVLILISPFSNSKRWYNLLWFLKPTNIDSYYKILCMTVVLLIILVDIICLCVIEIPKDVKFFMIACHTLLTGFIILLSLIINRLAILISEKAIVDTKLHNIARSQSELKSLLSSANVEDYMMP